MEKGWSRPEHVGKVVVSILDSLTKFYHAEESKGDEKDINLMIRLSQAAGYQAQIYAGLQKTFDMVKRIESVEKVLEHADPELLAMGANPVVIHEEDERTKFALR
jgi:hypothetical protein